MCRFHEYPTIYQFDGEFVRLVGKHKFTLAKYAVDPRDPCNFNIEVKAGYLLRDTRDTGLPIIPRYIEIQMFGATIQLAQGNRVSVSILWVDCEFNSLSWQQWIFLFCHDLIANDIENSLNKAEKIYSDCIWKQTMILPCCLLMTIYQRFSDRQPCHIPRSATIRHNEFRNLRPWESWQCRWAVDYFLFIPLWDQCKLLRAWPSVCSHYIHPLSIWGFSDRTLWKLWWGTQWFAHAPGWRCIIEWQYAWTYE